MLAMVAPICALPPLSDSLRDSESDLNVQCWTLVFVMGVCMGHPTPIRILYTDSDTDALLLLETLTGLTDLLSFIGTSGNVSLEFSKEVNQP